MFRLKLTLFFVVVFLQVLQISAQDNTANSNTNSKPANVQASPTASPANTVAPPTNTATPTPPIVTSPKTESQVIKIPSGNGEAEITFLGTNETDKNKLTLKVSYYDEKNAVPSSTPQKKTFLVDNTELKSLLSKFKEGDKVLLEYTKEKNSDLLKDVEVKSVTTNGLLPGLFIILIPIVGILLGHKLVLGEDNLYSKSKFQIVLWFFVLIGFYLVINALRVIDGSWDFVGGVGIPTNLLLLTGLSSLTFVGAKAIVENKDAKTSSDAAIAEGSIAKPTTNKPRFFYDLFHGDILNGVRKTGYKVAKLNESGQPILNAGIPEKIDETVAVRNVDLADFQMIIITLLAVAVYIVQAISFTQNIELHQFITLPDVDSTILAAFGLGQGAYLVKKYAE
ncbi:MAG: hypothetical protein HC846_10775 [Blastocatellia bacterium]|nr:hypothetical protein [Blastocatellia bacterium]